MKDFRKGFILLICITFVLIVGLNNVLAEEQNTSSELELKTQPKTVTLIKPEAESLPVRPDAENVSSQPIMHTTRRRSIQVEPAKIAPAATRLERPAPLKLNGKMQFFPMRPKTNEATQKTAPKKLSITSTGSITPEE